MKKYKKYTIRLLDTGGDGFTYTATVSAPNDITLEEIKKLYDKARKEWFEYDDPDDALCEYIATKLGQRGIKFTIVDFLDADAYWDF